MAPETPGSIHEAGELGYSLLHAYEAAYDNPDLLACCVVGDGEAETGALAASWHSNKFLNPVRDGAVLPILHLNGYKIAEPTVLARIEESELIALLTGYGYKPYIVAGDEPAAMHGLMAGTLDAALAEIREIQAKARSGGSTARPAWPMIVLGTPKGWTGPKVVDGKPVEGTFRAHQVPLADVRTNPDHLRMLADWMNGYRPAELFDRLAGWCPRSRRWRPKAIGAWGRTRTPMAGCCSRSCCCRTSAITRSPGRRRARSTRRRPVSPVASRATS